MPKALIVARAELASAVRSKAFLVSVVLMPVLMGISLGAQKLVAGHKDTRTRRFAVIDGTGQLTAPLTTAAEAWNALIDRGQVKAGRFVPVLAPSPSATEGADQVRLALSEQVRKKDLDAFVEIPASALGAGGGGRIAYHSSRPNEEELRIWLEITLNELIRQHRLRQANIDPALVAELGQRLPSEHLGLFERASDGSLRPARKVDRIRTLLVPIVFMFLVFMVVMTSAPQLLTSVLEEKMSRISEVLLGSVTPFELMLGKLLGSTGVTLLLAGIYTGGAVGAAIWLGHGGAIPLDLIPWMALFLILGAFFFGSLYIAVGAACSELRDAQSLMMPLVFLTVLPALVWPIVLKAPNGTLSTVGSLFPPATPFLMMLRLALVPPPPWWQLALSVLFTGVAALMAVWAAGKIFRIGVLMQGKPASYGQMLRWVFSR